MPRLFIAIDLPDTVKDQLDVLARSSIPGARWVKRHQMHLTLKFIGEVDYNRFESIQAKLESVESAAFEMGLKGVGTFPPKGKPRVLWVGLKKPPELAALHKAIENTLAEISIDRDKRAFSPHITLARFKSPTPRRAMDSFKEQNSTFKSNPIPVTEFVLYSSILSSSGPTYTAEATYSLKG